MGPECRRILAGALPALYSAVLGTAFFFVLVLLDELLGDALPVYSRDAVSHLAVLVIVVSAMRLLPEGLANWGVNLRNWRSGLTLGVLFGLGFAVLFSLFSYGPDIERWHLTNFLAALDDGQNVLGLLSQLFLVSSSEELLFRGILVTYLMRAYSARVLRIHVGVLIVSVVFGSLQFYKLLFGFGLGNVLPLVAGGFLYGLVLGWLYQRTQSVLGPIVTHGLCNSLMFAAGLGL